jgi:hypothetical protein
MAVPSGSTGRIPRSRRRLHGADFSAILLLDAVVTAPWITATTRHQQKWLEAYRTMPVHTYERVAAAYLATAFHVPPPDDVSRPISSRSAAPRVTPRGTARSNASTRATAT